MTIVRRLAITDIAMTITKPYGFSSRGMFITFMPYAEKIIVGIAITIVIIARTFIAMFRLFEITAAKVFYRFERISVSIFAISIACLFSTMTSSRRSESSSYFFTTSVRTSLSSTASFERRPVVK